MTNQEIYDAALRLASEVAVSDENQDYLERSGYLLATICSMCAGLDEAYRTARDLEPQDLPAVTKYDLEDNFPLSPAFAAPVSALLASLLVLQEAPELSERLNEVGKSALSCIRATIPFRIQPIVNRYEGM